MQVGQAKSSTTQEVYERLRADALASRLKPGTRLIITDLCRELNVSLGAVREALSRLTSEGLVVLEPQRGFRVAPISAFELEDLTSVRIEIEGSCLRRAIELGDVEWEARIVSAFHTLSRIPESQPGDPLRLNERWADAHAFFHEALVSGCGSPWLLRLRATLYAQSERYRRLSVPAASEKRDIEGEHRGIMQAVLARNAESAIALMNSHLLLTTKILLENGFVEPISNDV